MRMFSLGTQHSVLGTFFMLPEDSVLVGVINRKRDLVYALDQHWYRIPQDTNAARRHRRLSSPSSSAVHFGDRNGCGPLLCP